MGWLKRWWLAILWAALISSFSTGAFTAEKTGRFIIPILHWLLPSAAPETLFAIHFFIRKTGHFVEYFILSLLILRGIRAGRKGTRLKWALIVIAVVGGYAALDEFHQSFVPGRTAAVADVLLDTCGGIAAQIVAALAVLWSDVRERNRQQAGTPAETDSTRPD